MVNKPLIRPLISEGGLGGGRLTRHNTCATVLLINAGEHSIHGGKGKMFLGFLPLNREFLATYLSVKDGLDTFCICLNIP